MMVGCVQTSIRRQTALSSTASRSVDTRGQTGANCASTSRRSAGTGCIRRFGNLSTGPSQTVATSITRMRTPSTMTFPILNASPRLSMRASTWLESALRISARTLPKSNRSPQHGIALPRVERGTPSTLGWHLRRENRNAVRVAHAGPNSKSHRSAKSSSAATLARLQQGARLVSTTKTASAPGAPQRSLSTDTRALGAALDLAGVGSRVRAVSSRSESPDRLA